MLITLLLTYLLSPSTLQVGFRVSGYRLDLGFLSGEVCRDFIGPMFPLSYGIQTYRSK